MYVESKFSIDWTYFVHNTERRNFKENIARIIFLTNIFKKVKIHFCSFSSLPCQVTYIYWSQFNLGLYYYGVCAGGNSRDKSYPDNSNKKMSSIKKGEKKTKQTNKRKKKVRKWENKSKHKLTKGKHLTAHTHRPILTVLVARSIWASWWGAPVVGQLCIHTHTHYKKRKVGKIYQQSRLLFKCSLQHIQWKREMKGKEIR